MATGEGSVEVEVVCALPAAQLVLPATLPPGATVRDAISRSGVLEHCTGLNLEDCPVGIYGERVSLDTVVRTGDRVELYRPLVADPKDSRRRRAAKRKRQT